MTLRPSPSIEDEFCIDSSQQTTHLNNSEMLQQLPSILNHLSKEQQTELYWLLQAYPELFQDVPTQTTECSMTLT